MFGTRHRLAYRLQCALCALLVLNLNWVNGCGQGTLGLPTTAGAFQIRLSDSHPVTQALRGSAFQGAVLMEVYPQAQGFRLIYPDGDRQVSGAYSYTDGEFVITQFTFKKGAESATITFDASRQVSTITTSGGQSWTRPVEPASLRKASAAAVQSSNPYVLANLDLVAVAEEVDQNGGLAAYPSGNTGGTGGSSSSTTGGVTGIGYKNGNQEVIPSVAVVLALVTAIWAPLAGLLGPLLTIFSVASILETTMVLRFDGTWRANNATSNMLVTISGGKITKLVDESSQQELEVLSTRLDTISGNRVVWTVLAKVLGQSTEVEFTFDVQELADGTLEGTLTALGNTFARVSVTMSRA